MGANQLKRKDWKMAEKKNDSTTLVNFRVDPAVKESAEAVLGGMGLSVSAYVGMCLRQVAQDRKIPFTPSVDADFWMAENAVKEAMWFINMGLFMEACRAQEKANLKIANEDAFRRVIGNSFAAYLAPVESITMYGSYVGCDQSEAMVSASSEDGDEKAEFLEFLEWMRSYIANECREFLEGKGVVEKGLDDAEIVRRFDTVVWSPVTAYERHRSSFSLRFAGVGSDMDAFNKVVELSQKRNDKRDEQKEKKLLDEWNSVEREKNRFDFLTAMKALESLGNNGEEG